MTKTAEDRAPRYVHRYSAARGALPTLALWKRMVRAGALPSLKADVAAFGSISGIVTTKEVWWTGEGLGRLTAWLRALEQEEEPRPDLAYVGAIGYGEPL